MTIMSYTPPERTKTKHLLWLVSSDMKELLYFPNRIQGFHFWQAFTIGSLYAMSPPIFCHAALVTFGTMCSLSYIGATASYVAIYLLLLLWSLSNEVS